MSFKPRTYFIILAFFITLYIGLILSLPPDPTTLVKYNLTATQARTLSLSVAIPLIVIWTTAFYGFVRFKQYTALIKSSVDGKPLDRIADGQMLLAVTLPITAILGSVLNYISREAPEMSARAVIFRNYVTIILTLAAFMLIAQGARELRSLVKGKYTEPTKVLYTVIFVIVAAFYIYLTLRNPIRQFSADPNQRATFYLPDRWILLTIIVPYLCMWYLGLRSSSHIFAYQKNVAGHIYKPFLGALGRGISWVIFASIFLQFVVATSDTIAHLGLKSILILVYILLILISVGYVLIALAAKKLKKIEEV